MTSTNETPQLTAAEAAAAAAKAAAAVASAHDGPDWQRLKLMNKFSDASNMLIIDGRALVLYALTSAEAGTVYTHGGQVLHVVWAVEDLLKFLRDVGANPMVFFVADTATRVEWPLFHLCCEAVQRHLVTHTPVRVLPLGALADVETLLEDKAPVVVLSTHVASDDAPVRAVVDELAVLHPFLISRGVCVGFLHTINRLFNDLILHALIARTHAVAVPVSELPGAGSALAEAALPDVATSDTAVAAGAMVQAVAAVVADDAACAPLAQRFCVHLALLGALGVASRGVAMGEPNAEVLAFVARVQHAATLVLRDVPTNAAPAGETRWCDLMDAHLFTAVLAATAGAQGTWASAFGDALDGAVAEKAAALWAATGAAATDVVAVTLAAGATDALVVAAPSVDDAEPVLFPLADGVLGSILSEPVAALDTRASDDAEVAAVEARHTPVVENAHWNTNTPLDPSKDRNQAWMKNITRKQQLKMEQKMEAFWTRYGKSLLGGQLRAQEIVSALTRGHSAAMADVASAQAAAGGGAAAAAEEEPVVEKKQKGKKGKKNKGPSKKELKQQEKRRKQKEALDKKSADAKAAKAAKEEKDKWKRLRSKVVREISPDKQLKQLDASMWKLDSTLADLHALRAKAFSSKLKTANTEEEKIGVVREVLVSAFSVPKSEKKVPTEVLDALYDCGFVTVAKSLGFKGKKDEPLLAEQDLVEFQLRHMGDLMKRTPGVEDERVKKSGTFKPDPWQVRLLDIVDKDQSALVVAPTSSGKTFISYYAMERVLTRSDDDIVIYVAPTKPLVNQVRAEVGARFRKTYPKEASNRTVVGVFTSDYRHHADDCQVLVTVPECLEILMLSPTEISDARRRAIKYLILDEIHCIGQEMSWEHCIALTRAPFLALSATVEKPTDLLEWLQTKRAPGTVHMVPDIKQPPIRRFTDLCKHVVNAKGVVKPVHPLSLLDHKRMRDERFHVHMAPHEVLQLFDAMFAEDAEVMKHYTVQSVCGKKPFCELTRDTVYAWSDKLLTVLAEWSGDDADLTTKRARVLDRLGKSDVKAMTDEVDALPKPLQLVDFVDTMLRTKMLPAIMFSFSQAECEERARELLASLQARQRAWEEAHKDEIAANRARNKQVDKLNKQIEARNDKLKPGQEPEELHKRVVEVPHEEHLRGPFPYDEDRDDIEHQLRRLHDSFEWFRQAIHLGIGVHHAGLPSRCRRIVEVMFRKRQLSVVFATDTLAYGINMPCKTTVFSGSSIFLDSMMYRQASGRAGRRGHDLVGNVVFFRVPHRKLALLHTLSLPAIRPQFPLSFSFVLRVLLLRHQITDEAERAAFDERVRSQLDNPLLYFCKDTCHMPENTQEANNLHLFFRYAVSELQRANLLSRELVPQGWARLIAHMAWTEPTNFDFIDLVLEEVLQRHTNVDAGDPSDDTMRRLLAVLCGMFEQMPLPPIVDIPEGPGQVVQDDLPEWVMEWHTKRGDTRMHTLVSFVRQVHEVMTSAVAHAEPELPLSKVELPSAPCAEVAPPLDVYTVESETRKPCSALAGAGDAYTSVAQVAQTCKLPVVLDAASLPMMKMCKASSLNNVVLDFFKHKQSRALTWQNGINRSDAWRACRRILLVCKELALAAPLIDSASEHKVNRNFNDLLNDLVETYVDRFDTFNV